MQKFLKMLKEFDDLKNKFSKAILSNEQLGNELKKFRIYQK